MAKKNKEPYIKYHWEVGTFQEGDPRLLKQLNHLEQGAGQNAGLMGEYITEVFDDRINHAWVFVKNDETEVDYVLPTLAQYVISARILQTGDTLEFQQLNAQSEVETVTYKPLNPQNFIYDAAVSDDGEKLTLSQIASGSEVSVVYDPIGDSARKLYRHTFSYSDPTSGDAVSFSFVNSRSTKYVTGATILTAASDIRNALMSSSTAEWRAGIYDENYSYHIGWEPIQSMSYSNQAGYKLEVRGYWNNWGETPVILDMDTVVGQYRESCVECSLGTLPMINVTKSYASTVEQQLKTAYILVDGFLTVPALANTTYIQATGKTAQLIIGVYSNDRAQYFDVKPTCTFTSASGALQEIELTTIDAPIVGDKYARYVGELDLSEFVDGTLSVLDLQIGRI